MQRRVPRRPSWSYDRTEVADSWVLLYPLYKPPFWFCWLSHPTHAEGLLIEIHWCIGPFCVSCSVWELWGSTDSRVRTNPDSLISKRQINTVMSNYTEILIKQLFVFALCSYSDSGKTIQIFVQPVLREIVFSVLNCPKWHHRQT